MRFIRIGILALVGLRKASGVRQRLCLSFVFIAHTVVVLASAQSMPVAAISAAETLIFNKIMFDRNESNTVFY